MEAILIPETREIQEKSATIVQWAYGLLVTVETYPKAGELLRSIKALEKSVSDTFDVPIEAAHKAHKAILAAKAQHMDPLVKAEGIVKGKMGVHIQEQERIRAEQQRIADAAARKAEEDARLAEAQVLEEIGETEAAEAVIEEPIVTAPVI
ncbi:MAG: hypothetical protein U1E51_27325, partial [Candidatus Binatia bacterium]|nr:hypothetical protein [Candidatus Binatia bacterium]